MSPHAPKVTLGPLQKRSLYAVTAALCLSGAVWIWLRYFGAVQGTFGPEPSPLQPVFLKLHGAAAMTFLVVLGALLPQHVALGWRTKRQRPSGASILAVCAALTATGWCLYYAGSDGLRAYASWIHTVLGLALPAFITLHARLARKRKTVRMSHRGIPAPASSRP
jgi:hypothetical protein